MTTGSNFWDASIWSFVISLTILMIAMLVANMLRHAFPALAKLMIPSSVLGGFLNGKVMSVAACSTTQVDDYSKFAMGMFNPEERKDKRENQFPQDLQAAFDLGAELSR